MRKVSILLAAAAITGGAGAAAIAGLSASAEKPTSIDDPDWTPGRFVEIAHPNGDVVRSLDGNPVLFDRNLFSQGGTTRGSALALVLWRVVGDDSQNQAEADRRIAQALEDLSNGSLDPNLAIPVFLSEDEPAE